MNKLNINLQNCFGIGSLQHEFDFNRTATFLVYAPNGTMKTSFAKTFNLLAKNESKNRPRDMVYHQRETKCSVEVDGSPINPTNILVINAEDDSFDASNKISTFLASKDLKKRYDEIYRELDVRKAELLRKLKGTSQSNDCEGEIVGTFDESGKESFFEILKLIGGDLKDDFVKPGFRYNFVFDNKGAVKKFLENHKTVINQYVSDYKEIVSNSRFFRETASSTFGTYQANEIIKSIADNSFFEAGHKFVLQDSTEITDIEILKKLIEEEIKSILSDEKLKKSFEKVDKAIVSNTELRQFQRVIDKDKFLLLKLENYEEFRKEVWVSFISEFKSEALELVAFYNKQAVELKAIVTDAKKEIILWKSIIETFNIRFYVPFRVVISNQDDIILKEGAANLEFEYSDRDDAPVRQKRENLLAILSKGEQRAYFILQFLFEIESRKINGESSLLIFDDVADSFDYKNKFAIIEYIKDLHSLDSFKVILLTHNFDFYRTIASRLNLPSKAVYMATKSVDKTIKLHNGQYRRDVFTHFIGRYSEEKVFISLIAFVRNIIEYSEEENSLAYLTLTSCLHLKTESNDLTANDIFTVFQSKLQRLVDKTISFGTARMIDLIYGTAEAICLDPNLDEILLENKITLAIAIRLRAEEYLLKRLETVGLPNQPITSNQTHELFTLYKQAFQTSAALLVLEKVNLMTPENIHVNAFMYEPLIDMSVYHLRDLLGEMENLNVELNSTQIA